MALLTPQQTATTGKQIAYTAATGGGDTTGGAGNGHVYLSVRNASGSSINTTLTVPGKTADQQNYPTVVVACPTGQDTAIGPFRQDHVDPTSGLITWTYSSVTSITVALVSC